MRFIAISDARSLISSFAETPENTVLTRNGQPVAVVMPIQEYRCLRALSKLAQSPGPQRGWRRRTNGFAAAISISRTWGRWRWRVPAPYSRVKSDIEPLSYLGGLPAAAAECLEQAFAHIRTGGLRLWKLDPRQSHGPLFGKACGHLIYGSESPTGDTFVISELLRDSEDDFL